ncbi:hypothetical protein [Aquiflexum sp.]|uniref:hypothetical protein n=1 Tax=Aquiflexum sp. TaxID=1872584 RepID=UPI003593D3C1
MYRLLLTCLFSVFIIGNISAQRSRDHVSAGFGLGMMYGDNSGIYKFLQFKNLPAFSVAYSKEMSDKIDIRASIGGQIINSGEYRPLNSPKIVEWGNNEQAYFFKGNAFFADVMPILYLNPNQSGRAGEPVNYYIGLGLGGLYSQRAQRVLRDGVIENGMLVAGAVERSNQTLVTPYVPIKLGMSTNLEYEWDLAFEMNVMGLASSEIDGNIMTNKLFNPDVLVNFQVVLRRYFRR